MSIEEAIENAQQKVANAYTAVENKGGTLPATQNLSNLPTAINTISTAGTVETLNVTPTTSAQQFVPTGGVDGYNLVNVSAVTSSIDANIQSSNIKSGVTILGTQGNVTELKGETRSVSLTNSAGQTFTPTSGKNGITSITVTPNNQARTVTPTTSQQSLTVNSGYSGNGTITVNAVTSAIDQNIVAGNIKNGVSILGITGNYTGTTPTGTLNITQNGIYNVTNYASANVSVSGGGGGATLSYSWKLDDLEILNEDWSDEVETIYNLLENDYTPYYDFSEYTFTFKDANGNDFAYSVVDYNFELEQNTTELYDDNIWVTSFIIICNAPPGSAYVGKVAVFNLYIEKI